MPRRVPFPATRRVPPLIVLVLAVFVAVIASGTAGRRDDDGHRGVEVAPYRWEPHHGRPWPLGPHV